MNRGGVRLKPRAVEASWDADLAPAMLRRSAAVHEERVLASLLPDLRQLDDGGTGPAG